MRGGPTTPEPTREGIDPATAELAPDPKGQAFHEQLQRLREAELDEIERGSAGARSSRGPGSSENLRPSGVNGLMPDPEDDLDDEEASWL